MKKIIFILFNMLFAVNNLYAQNIITVDNATPSAGDYSKMQAAHDAAGNGDTIYVYPSGVSYGAITVTKKLHFIGTGFDAPGNALNTTNISGTMKFNTGCDGSSLEGFGGLFSIVIDADNVTIKRNKVKKITINTNHTGTVILQNLLHDSSYEYLLTVAANNEILIANNVFDNTAGYGGNAVAKGISATNSDVTITILHNVLNLFSSSASYALNLGNSNKYVANNIIIKGGCTGTSNGYYYNMSNGGQLPSGDGNIRGVDMSNVFEGFYHLKDGSPAIGAGQNGVDMGIYGGSTPFNEGGAPGLPLIFELNADHLGTHQNGLDVTIKAKTVQD